MVVDPPKAPNDDKVVYDTMIARAFDRAPAKLAAVFFDRQPRSRAALTRAPRGDVQVFGRAHVEQRIHLSQQQCGTRAETKDRLRVALRSMGFRNAELERAEVTIQQATAQAWTRPIEDLVREALRVLT
jgi:hypothetical protein